MTDSPPDPNCSGCRALSKQVEELLALVSRLERRISQLETKLRQNSSNSHRPPSSDPPWSKPTGSAPPTKRRRGAQPGHEKSDRKLLPPDEVHCCKPDACENCGAELFGKDRSPLRHQVTEIPQARAETREYRLHQLKCRSCGHVTRASLPPSVPRGAFGPQLQAMVALWSGAYRISRRNVQQLMLDTFGVELSLGAISKIEWKLAETLREPHQAALQAVCRASSVHSDETSWREANQKAWLWTAATEKVSVFLIRRSRGSDVAKELIGEDFEGTHISDRWSSYNWIDIAQRQVCWAHLIRDFRKIAESGGTGEWIGGLLERKAKELFAYWHRVRDGTMKRSTFRRHARRIRRSVRSLLEFGASSHGWRAPSMCRGILELEEAMWTFVAREGVEPTNNLAERTLRPAVIWRKTSHGTQSERGSRFAERMLSCVTTLRQQQRNALQYLTAAIEAGLQGVAIPSFIR
ncbi:MAG: IS66 family transposase [Polyangiales bacterium]